jgi:hypothetical protein
VSDDGNAVIQLDQRVTRSITAHPFFITKSPFVIAAAPFVITTAPFVITTPRS